MYTLSDLDGVSYPNHVHHDLYRSVVAAINRCHKVNHNQFIDYGARGISVQMSWRIDNKQFILWILNNLGPRPIGKTLDRLNNDGNYDESNLHWATKYEQTRNRRVLSTNTGESGISYCNRNGKSNYIVRIESKYIGCKSSLADAIILRDSKC